MRRYKKIECDECGLEVDKIKYLKKIKDKRYCKECYKENRGKHRNELLKIDKTLKEDLNKIKREDPRTKEYVKKAYLKKTEGIVKRRNQKRDTKVPRIKGSKEERKSNKSNSYLTHEEINSLKRMLSNKGLSWEEIDERIENLINSQKEIRRSMKEQNKSEEEIKSKQQILLQELWNY